MRTGSRVIWGESSDKLKLYILTWPVSLAKVETMRGEERLGTRSSEELEGDRLVLVNSGTKYILYIKEGIWGSSKVT